MKVQFTLGERTVVNWVISALPGVNRTDARLSTQVADSLKLDELSEGLRVSRRDGEMTADEYEVTHAEIQWIKDKAERLFDESKVPPGLIARWLLGLVDRLNAVLKEGEKE